MPNVGDRLMAEIFHVVRVPERVPRESSRVSIDVLLGPDLEDCDWVDKFGHVATSIKMGSRDALTKVCQTEGGLLVVAHGYRDRGNSLMTIDLGEHDRARIVPEDFVSPPSALFLLSCFSGLPNRSMGLSLGSDVSHAAVAAVEGSQAILAGIIDLLTFPAAAYFSLVLETAMHEPLPFAVYSARQFYLEHDLSPDELLTVVGSAFYSDLSVVAVEPPPPSARPQVELHEDALV